MDELKNIDKNPALKEIKSGMDKLESEISKLLLEQPKLAKAVNNLQSQKRAVAVDLELGKADKKALSKAGKELSEAKQNLSELDETIEIKKLAFEQLKSDYDQIKQNLLKDITEQVKAEQKDLNKMQVEAFKKFLAISEQLKDLEDEAQRAGIPFSWKGFRFHELRTRYQPRLPWWIDKMTHDGLL